MKLSRQTFFVGALALIVGFVAGNAFWYLASPLWIDRVVAEDIGEALTAKVISQGKFGYVDALHHAEGTATIYEGVDGAKTLRFENFKATNGPDLKVWLVAKADVTTAEDVTGGEWVSLGPLKGNIGDQNYALPADIDLSRYQSVVIWCEQFSVLFSPATMTRLDS